MRVLLLKNHVGSGGIMSWLLLHGRELRQRGIDCDYWFCQPGARSEDFVPLGARTGPAAELVRKLEGDAYDIVHIANDDPLSDLLCTMRPCARIVVTAHSNLAQWKSHDCLAYTAVSHGLAKLNQNLSDIAIDVIHNAIDCSRFSPSSAPPKGKPIVAWVGRTTDPQKDFARFTRIAALIANLGLRFWVADAHGGDTVQMKKIPGAIPIPVERWEKIAHSDMPSFYQDVASSGGVLLLTSRYEGLGMALLEAAACGLPAVAPDVGGVAECIRAGVTGTVFDSATSDIGVARLISEWIAQGNLAHRIQACADFAQSEFSPQTMTSRYLEVYSRKEPLRLQNAPKPWSAHQPGLADLLAKYEKSGLRRANALRSFARQLSAENKQVSRKALWRSIGLRPQALANPKAFAHVVKTALLILRRPRRPLSCVSELTTDQVKPAETAAKP
jgi:glycosyltransferase involved in cell wall biosynthesis